MGTEAGSVDTICLVLLTAIIVAGPGMGCSHKQGGSDADLDPGGDSAEGTDTDVLEDPGDPPPDESDPDAEEEAELPVCTEPPGCSPVWPPAPGEVGASCTSPGDCLAPGSVCLTETPDTYDGETYVDWPGGTCVIIGAGGVGCDPEAPSSCPTGTRCVHLGWDGTCNLVYACMDTCMYSVSSMVWPWNCGCRDGYECNVDMEVCLPGCSNDRECCESWDDADGDTVRDAGEVSTDAGCANQCDGDDPIEFEWTGCMASFQCENAGDPAATFGSPCVFDSDCPASARCVPEHAAWEACDVVTPDPDGPVGIHSRYPGGACTLELCDVPGRECPAGAGGECVNFGTFGEPIFACWDTCHTGHGPGDPENECRDDDPDHPWTCWPWAEDYWLEPSATGADGICLPAGIPDPAGPSLPLFSPCTEDDECASPLGLGSCAVLGGAPGFCTVACSQGLTEGDAHVCGSPATAGEFAPAVCWSGLCLPACTTPNGAIATNDCPVPAACFDNGDWAYGAYSYYDLDGTQPTGFCFTACLDNEWCQEVFGAALSCNPTTGQCGT